MQLLKYIFLLNIFHIKIRKKKKNILMAHDNVQIKTVLTENSDKKVLLNYCVIN